MNLPEIGPNERPGVSRGVRRLLVIGLLIEIVIGIIVYHYMF
jgi:hypothetical protein